MTFKPCALVPSYNHYLVVGQVVSSLRELDLDVFVIDDGSACKAATTLAALHAPEQGVHVIRFEENRGKGNAVIAGMRLALESGFTHGVQVDADGQHDAKALPELLRLSEESPDALISGRPIYDDTIPMGRKIGRWVTHVWVWIETLSFQIKDSMCGYRVYPLDACQALLEHETVGQRMDFDTEIMVRLFWRGVPIKMMPVRVTYPEDNISNFDVLWDNWRITKMHTRLVLTMLGRFPTILCNRPKQQFAHWAQIEERGVLWGISFLVWVHRLLGQRACLHIMYPILLYFFVTGGQQRNASIDYWCRIGPLLSPPVRPGFWQSFLHFRSFARMALEKVSAWNGDIALDDLTITDQGHMDAVIKSKQGVFVIASHLGNLEVCRALSRMRSGQKLTVLIHSKNAQRFNKAITRINPDSGIDMVQVDELGPATAIELQDRLERGEWIVMAGDRIPVTLGARISMIEFLGQDAPFGQGSIILAALLGAPVYMMLCLTEGSKYNVIFERLSDKIVLPRQKRVEVINEHLRAYARFLETHVKRYPLQWYNMFDFWKVGPQNHDVASRNSKKK